MAKKKAQKNKQRSTKNTHKTTDRVTQTPPKTGGELRCSGRNHQFKYCIEKCASRNLHTLFKWSAY